ncbi:MAG: HAD-IA family hydrolase [Nitrospirota bacterium]
MFSLYIFDLDGTLIDSRQDIANAVNRTFADLKLPPLPHETIYSFVGNGVYKLMTDATGSSDPAFLKQTLQIFEQHYLANLLDKTVLYPGMRELLDQNKNRRKSVATNKRVPFTRQIIAGLCPSDFELILGAEEGVKLKPDPEMLLKTLTQLNVPAQETILIGDMINDIAAARAAGIKICAVGYGFGNEKELKAASPDFYAKSVEELKAIF